jgi:HPt (histidine-containing phosphotransfer) domain-containing protein
MFDAGKLENLIGPSVDDQRMVLERLLSELRAVLPAMQQACETQCWGELLKYVHKYRGTSSVVGATHCAEVLGALEQCLYSPEPQRIAALMADIPLAIQNFERAVRTHLGQTTPGA